MVDAARPNVIITESSGFLGQSMARALADCDRVTGLDRHQPDAPPGEMDTVEVDITSDGSAHAALKHIRDIAGERAVPRSRGADERGARR